MRIVNIQGVDQSARIPSVKKGDKRENLTSLQAKPNWVTIIINSPLVFWMIKRNPWPRCWYIIFQISLDLIPAAYEN